MFYQCSLKYLIIVGLCYLTQGLTSPYPAHAQEGSSIETTYDIFWKGIRVFTMEGETELFEQSYNHKSHMRSRGVLRWFLKAGMDIEARGKTTPDGKTQAEFYRSYSKWNKNIYEREVRFNEEGKALEIIVNIPKDNDEKGYREEVPEEFQISPDPISLFIGMMADPNNLFKSDSLGQPLSSFDGSRSMAYEPNCNFPNQTLEYTRKSAFKGDAYYCEITLSQTGGFWHGDEDATDKVRDEDEEQKPLKVWYGKTETGHYLPVKMEFKSGRGTLKIYLKELNRDILSIKATQNAIEP